MSVKEEEFCRFCNSAADSLISIFGEVGASFELQNKISEYLPIAVSVDDNLPQALCYSCVELLQTWDSFVRMCVQNDGNLRGVPKGVETEKVENDAVEVSIDVAGQSEPENNDTFQDSDDEPLTAKLSLDEINQLKARAKRKASSDSDCKPREKKKSTSSDEGIRGKPENSFNCDKCGRMVRTKRSLAVHIRSCINKLTFSCDICGSSYRSQHYLNRHKDKEHSGELEECEQCHNLIKSNKMRQHVKLRHNRDKNPTSKEIKCKYCVEIFESRSLRATHVKTVHMKEEIKCEQCDFQGRRDQVLRHTKNRHSEKTYACNQCPMAFKTFFMLKGHLTSHSNVRCYTCDICGKGFKRLNNVKEHVKSHQAKSLQCQICGNFFQRKRYLAIHEKTIHNFYADGSKPTEKGFECTVCGTRLKWKKNLMAHMRIHTGEKPYWCKICNKAFICHGALRTHMGKHDVAMETSLPSQMQEPTLILMEKIEGDEKVYVTDISLG